MNLYFKQIESYLFWFLSLLFVFIIIGNSLIITVGSSGVVSSGMQVGGRIISVSPAGCQLPSPAGSGPDPICSAIGCAPNTSTQGVMVAPYGWSGSGLCPLITMPVFVAGKSGGTITPAFQNGTIMGLFQTPLIPGPTIPIGVIGVLMP